MTKTKIIPASNWTGREIEIEILSPTRFRLYGTLFTLIEKADDCFKIVSEEYGTSGTVMRFDDGECLATACGIEREGSDIITVAAQVLANTI